VAEFIESLDAKSRAKVARILDLLEEFGTDLGMPYVKYLEKQLWELRVQHGRSRYRTSTSWRAAGPLFCSMPLPRRPRQYPENTWTQRRPGETTTCPGGGEKHGLERAQEAPIAGP